MTITTTAQAMLTSAERAAAGRLLRDRVPRSSHSAWSPPPDRRDPLLILAESDQDRVAQFVPLRYARMAESPFAFFRGSAAVMAADLAATPATGLRVALCGDAHCLNFGAYATPERRLIFDVTDFDETLPGPWEWDVKRLTASLVLAAHSINLRNAGAHLVALSAVRSYRRKMLEFAAATALDTWYSRVDAASVPPASNPDDRSKRRQIVEYARAHSMQAAVDKYTVRASERRFVEDPPLMYHAANSDGGSFDIDRVFATYATSLRAEVRVLFGRYRLVDHAVKVVGVGSVGTRSSVALLQADGDDALILQIKEAQASVLEPFAGASEFGNHGERVVFGQRLMQSASDVFLGWGTSGERDFYVRQFRDKKGSVNIGAMDGYGLRDYAQMCAWALANAHARSGDAAQIAGYLGKADTFDKAVVRFALLYAEQVQSDYAVFEAAIEAGAIAVA